MPTTEKPSAAHQPTAQGTGPATVYAGSGRLQILLRQLPVLQYQGGLTGITNRNSGQADGGNRFHIDSPVTSNLVDITGSLFLHFRDNPAPSWQ